ncbi:hypothetical protein [Aquitalea sp.]|uniref:hypothetical protein n=1 Tax=Aquitalea sp. TaxID=1872623 RepID=UPI00258D276B|nr:hypothetical protein [Aquitalea sp.]
MSADVLYNGHKADANATFDGMSGTVILNGIICSTTDVLNLHGAIYYNKIAPCLDVGGDNPVSSKKGLGFSWNAGVTLLVRPALIRQPAVVPGSVFWHVQISRVMQLLKSRSWEVM